MWSYPMPGRESDIDGYEIFDDSIYVRFQGGRVYGYSYQSAGAVNVEKMKRLANSGEGLARYIRENVYSGYFYKGDESGIPYDPEAYNTETKGIAKMPKALRGFDFRPLLVKHGTMNAGIRVFYTSTVAPEDEVPGLREFVETEYAHILHYRSRFFRTDDLPYEIYIELSDMHIVKAFGTMTDSQIVKAVQSIYRRNPVPDPQEVKDILAQRMTKGPLNGVYHVEPRHIKLYYRMFDTKHGPEHYLAQIRKTLAHELLHAMHHKAAYDTFRERISAATRVKESLADFFAFIYVLDPDACRWGRDIFERGIQVAAQRYREWDDKLGTAWPYAYALMYLPEIDGRRMPFTKDFNAYMVCMGKYMEVWGASLHSMRMADDILMC